MVENKHNIAPELALSGWLWRFTDEDYQELSEGVIGLTDNICQCRCNCDRQLERIENEGGSIVCLTFRCLLCLQYHWIDHNKVIPGHAN